MVSDTMEGSPAPDFELPSDGGGRIRLSGLRGRKIVLYFYPKDDTSGCTREAVDFSALVDDFGKAGAVVVGVSPDPVAAPARVKAKPALAVGLASDEEKAVLQAYGVWKEKSMYGRKFMGVERSTFLIDGNGVIRRIWRKVKVAGHAEEVLQAARAV